MHRLLQPWSDLGRLASSLAYVAIGLPLGIASFTVLITLLATTAGLVITLVLAVPVGLALFTASRGFGRLERSRAAALLGVELVDPVAPLSEPRWYQRLGERLTSKARWREIGHGIALLPVACLSFTLASVAWCGSLALLSLPVLAGTLPGGTAKFWLFEVGSGLPALLAGAIGAIGVVLVAPWATLAAANLQVWVATRLVGQTSEAELAARVARAEQRSAAAVGSAETERRRIERDLHDGAQQRLVALAAQLGEARQKLDEGDPADAQQLVSSAHEESKAALKEIRDLVRGIHPVILEDRGLDAALSAVVARSPIPVTLDVQLEPRPSAAAESTAYFVVNEALTNVARHAQATRASVAVARAGDRMVIEVHDDGIGGADASRGTGLQGLRERVVGLGGSLHVISPDGGPTTISVELPCGS